MKKRIFTRWSINYKAFSATRTGHSTKETLKRQLKGMAISAIKCSRLCWRHTQLRACTTRLIATLPEENMMTFRDICRLCFRTWSYLDKNTHWKQVKIICIESIEVSILIASIGKKTMLSTQLARRHPSGAQHLMKKSRYGFRGRINLKSLTVSCLSLRSI